jgi:hypothetical protein
VAWSVLWWKLQRVGGTGWPSRGCSAASYCQIQLLGCIALVLNHATSFKITTVEPSRHSSQLMPSFRPAQSYFTGAVMHRSWFCTRICKFLKFAHMWLKSIDKRVKVFSKFTVSTLLWLECSFTFILQCMFFRYVYNAAIEKFKTVQLKSYRNEDRTYF